FLYHSGLLTLAGLARRRRGALVLRYHAVTEGAGEVPYATPEICIPVEGLRLQMAFVKRAYTVLPLHELVELVRRGATLPPRALAGVMLGWAQVRELAAAGWTVGAHTVTHPNVALAAPAEAEAEIAGSRDAIAAALGDRPLHFAYPNSGGEHRYFDAAVAGV